MSVSDGNHPFMRRRMLPALLALICAVPAGAQQEVPDPRKPPAMEQEVIVTGRRNDEPDFQEQNEFHFQEYRRLKQIYDPDPLPVIRSDRLVRMPEAVSSTVQGKPTLTEKQW